MWTENKAKIEVNYSSNDSFQKRPAKICHSGEVTVKVGDSTTYFSMCKNERDGSKAGWCSLLDTVKSRKRKEDENVGTYTHKGRRQMIDR
jgi:hypothetical protein